MYKQAQNSVWPTFKRCPKNLSTTPVNIKHTCHMEFHVDFPSTRKVMGCNPKLPSCKPKVGACDTLWPMRGQGFSRATARCLSCEHARIWVTLANLNVKSTKNNNEPLDYILLQGFCVGWMGGILVCNKPLSSSTNANKVIHNHYTN